MTIIDQIINQVSSFTQELSLASIGSFGGRVLTFVTSTPVILVAIAAILAVGVCVYMYSNKASKLDEPKPIPQQHSLLAKPSECPMFYQSENLKQIKLPLLPKANYYLRVAELFFNNDAIENEISPLINKMDEKLPIIVINLEEGLKENENQGMGGGSEVNGKKYQYINLRFYDGRIDLRNTAKMNRMNLYVLIRHEFKVENEDEIKGIIAQMAISLK